ncbi:MAG: hypothetical protein Tsb0034_07160 [Ekhidna sp.]
MKTVTIKMSDELFEKVESIRKKEGKNRSSYLIDLVEKKIKENERERLAEKLREESLQVAKQYEKMKDELKDWDNAIFDYEKYYGLDSK